MWGRGGHVDNRLAPHVMSGQCRESSAEHQRVVQGKAENSSSERGQRGYICMCSVTEHLSKCLQKTLQGGGNAIT